MTTTANQNERVAFIQAGWHKDITDQGKKTFIEDMVQAGFPEKNIDLYETPGSLEIPLQAQLLAKSGKYDAIVCTGLIVNGGIYRHEFVTAAVIDGIMRVSLDTEVPVLSVILTPQNFHEHAEHNKFFFDHFKVKGREAAAACLATLANMRALKSVKKAA
ncbi:MAG TPA: 6,7-dimethyl-8-ribityllumazine synthase [Micavibrio sp.]|nr:6,7-dimethyl-8-ribityllumazine synthase [Micavibrio sp.]